MDVVVALEEEEEEEDAVSAFDGSFATESKRARLRDEPLAAFGSLASLRVRDLLRGIILFLSLLTFKCFREGLSCDVLVLVCATIRVLCVVRG